MTEECRVGRGTSCLVVAPCVCVPAMTSELPSPQGFGSGQGTAALSKVAGDPLGPAPTAVLRQWVLDGCLSGALPKHFQVAGQGRERGRGAEMIDMGEPGLGISNSKIN